MSTYIPSEQLRPFVRGYRIIESQEGVVNRVLPDTSFALAFRFRGQISYLKGTEKAALPLATISGLRTLARLISYSPKTAAIIVALRETAAGAFLKQPLQGLFGESVPLHEFFPVSEISIIEERLAGTESNRIRVAVVEDFLRSKLNYSKADSLVENAIAKIYSTKGMVRITELADSLSISQDAFEKRFRKRTGATPKQFSNIVRMKAIILYNPSPSSFLDMALGNGFYDQAHFNKGFKNFTGQTPTDFLKSASYW